MKALHLFLRYKWWDMIKSGKKYSEYRRTDYWADKIINKGYTHVILHRGYTNITMTFEIYDPFIGLGLPLWGAPRYEKVVIIPLKKLINEHLE